MPGRRLLLAGAYALYLLALLETASRIYWLAVAGVPLTASRKDWYGIFYPRNLESGVLEADLRPDDGRFDVLLLGGSTLHFLYEHRQQELRERFRELSGREVRIFDLAHVAHTLRDSVLKYRLLGDKRFDLVVVYDAINDTRMNNAPRELYRDDYGHAAWYAKLDRLERRAAFLPWLSLPFSLDTAGLSLLAATGLRASVPRHFPLAGWTGHGADVKTAAAFRANLAELLDTARRRGDPVLLMTFAWYLPEGYSLDRYLAGELDLEPIGADGRPIRWRHPIELWGIPSYVAKGVQVHNEVIREFASRPGVVFVDAAAAIPAEGRFFHDICHLAPRGEELWMQAFFPPLTAFFAGSGAEDRRAAYSR